MKVSIRYSEILRPCLRVNGKYLKLKNEKIIAHVYCPNTDCKEYLGVRHDVKDKKQEQRLNKNCKCGEKITDKNVKIFLTLNLATQIEKKIVRPQVKTSLNYGTVRVKRNPKALEDVFDGKEYVKIHSNGQLKLENSLSYTLYGDGSLSSESGKGSTWPVFIKINEVPPSMRAQNMILYGLWTNDSHPNMNTLLKPFVKEANILSSNGMDLDLGDNRIVSTKILPGHLCVDSHARCKFLNMSQYNGRHGCTFCKIKTTKVSGVKHRKFVVSGDIPPLRTQKETEIQATKSARGEFSQKLNNEGVKGISELMYLKNFDTIKNQIPDPIHNISGVTEKYFELLLTGVKKEYYIGNPKKLLIMNERIKNIHVPSCVPRSPRTLDFKKLYKANEWYMMAMFYTLPIFWGILNEKYLIHFAMFSKVLYYLHDDSITKEMIDESKQLVDSFVILFQNYFGKSNMVYNIHLLFHMAKCVTDWGPLWANNCFCFEDGNRKIILLKQTSTQINRHIINSYLLFDSLVNFSSLYKIHPEVDFFCRKIFENRVKFFTKSVDCTLLGKGENYHLTKNELRILPISFESYDRCQKTVIIFFKLTQESFA